MDDLHLSKKEVVSMRDMDTFLSHWYMKKSTCLPVMAQNGDL